MRRLGRTLLALWVASAMFAVRGRDARATDSFDVESDRGSGEPLPEELEGVAITERLGAKIPRDLEFRDDRGRRVQFGDLVGSGMPTLLTFNYSKCPLLCSVQLGGLTQVMAKMRYTPGEQFRVVTVVLDPTETPERARETKLGYLGQLDRARSLAKMAPVADGDAGWTFLVGSEDSVRAIADAVGFGYTYHPGRKEYLHPAAFMMITPKGTVAQYVYGVSFEAERIDAAVASAALGVTTESEQSFILSCYHYEPISGLDGFRVMQIVGIAFGLAVVVVIASIHLRSRAAHRRQAHGLGARA